MIHVPHVRRSLPAAAETSGRAVALAAAALAATR